MIGAAIVPSALVVAAAGTARTFAVVLDNVRIIDGSGAVPIENGRILIDTTATPASAATQRSLCLLEPRGSTSPAAL